MMDRMVVSLGVFEKDRVGLAAETEPSADTSFGKKNLKKKKNRRYVQKIYNLLAPFDLHLSLF